MDPQADSSDHPVTDAWEQHHAYLVNLAFRMLGDVGAAEDAVQEAFARFWRADRDTIDDERGWLIVVTSRLCLDHMRSARVRREQYHDTHDFETVLPAPSDRLADPADRVTLDDTVRHALLVVLEQLTPAERVVFVMHDVFQFPFETIAETVGRSPSACRQLASRARRRVRDASTETRFTIDAGEYRAVTEKFIAACTNGDLDALLAVLDTDVDGDVIFVGMPRPTTPVTRRGALTVAQNFLRFFGNGATLVAQSVEGKEVVLAYRDRELAALLELTIEGDRIHHVHATADVAKFAGT
jgi:RNA polymerase sigma-70 factor (ECF subfamily)